MDHMIKTEERTVKIELPKGADGKGQTFQFCYEKEVCSVPCGGSMTVLNALNTSQIFQRITKKPKNMNKEILIQRRSKEVPRAAVKINFPCCLFEEDEIVDVSFIKNDEKASTEAKTAAAISCPSTPEKLVTFFIKKNGGEKIRRLLKSNALMKTVDYVCVYAFKEEKLKTALKHDGRFINAIFRKHCALLELNTQINYEMSHKVEHLNGKVFQVVVISDINQPDSQEDYTPADTESNVAPENASQDNLSAQNHNKTEQEKPQNGNTKSSAKSLKVLESIPNSEEIKKILCDQFKDLLKTLKERENLRDNLQVQKFFRAEYDKSVQSFSEVKKVKQLMGLSDSVCLIMVKGSARGTGFLLFDRFILTNAHVIREFDPFTKKLSKTFTAVFGYEDVEFKETKSLSIKEHFVACYHGMNDTGMHLDFALLELSIDERIGCPELLSRCSHGPTPNRGGICIVGHPAGGVKKMDPCFIIERENRKAAVNKHKSENVELIHVMTKQSIDQKWEFREPENLMTYNTCFFHGSSGSPVFDEDCYLIGMHTGGYDYKGHGGKTRSVIEYAYSMEPILESIVKEVEKSGRFDILNLLSEFKSGNDVEMTEEPQNQED
ncbi:serine protease FAM111A-like [Xyrauchen texanus]|uniref:serine protease FAM111A-like n=1 Tax=Xyrauchen texanus TaxID=154827 RepID=UPI0022426168|nr:serine protease FAM111A-like [Xyrauchen texanus]XP_051949834.1 serine protease FAM111A-like [Xyrauchen texanus]XP_051949837.1 serine protease FAM111A-like [Xyrauchen texanus]XP_051949843.1 serine protease FAM111A-like [Xyrauchen texanus]XP_051949848.1 serine protease FAM111A-like [Xyrauchen texanus]XP_051949852.1 serine protease FAM111A-like [Xyrauchen texanus]XP_051949858.1 serine protease FAM111A-like [Xyrauchen texanus]